MSVTLVRGDAAHLPLPDGCVDLVVTSPPYFALRSYQDTPQLCARCIELIGKDWLHPNPVHLRNLKEAWPDWDAHVAEFHVPHHYPGQIGSEATPAEFIDALIACTAEWVRVLKPSGSLWVNLGDKYAGSRPDGSTGWDSYPLDRPKDGYSRPTHKRMAVEQGELTTTAGGIRPKSLMGLPWRYALRCIDDLGLILRAEIIWSKPNGLPESVTDRVRRSHEQWFHLTRQPRYYAAVDTIREPQTGRVFNSGHHSSADDVNRLANGARAVSWRMDSPNPLGKLPGSVWSIPSQPLTVPPELGVDHFAAFPMEWPRRLILGWSPSGICTRCGEGRRPVSDVARVLTRLPLLAPRTIGERKDGGNPNGRPRSEITITGECCACTPYTDHPGSGEPNGPHGEAGNIADDGILRMPANGNGRDETSLQNRPRVGPWREYHDWTPPPTRPAIVLDPFSGTGTVCLMADVLGRHGIGVDLSYDYCRLARWRTTDPGERARAMQVEKPAPVMDGQTTIFDML